MASVYTNDLRLEEIGSGEQSGSWGDTTNTNLELIAEAFAFGTEAITTNADTHATTIADGATDPGRAMFLKYTGTLDSACTITLGPNTVSKLWFIENGTSGSQNIIIKQGSGATITIPPGDTKAIYSNGAGSGGAMVDAFASLSVVDLKVQDDLTVTDDVAIGGLATIGETLAVTGIATFTDDIIIGDGKTIGSASTVAAITIASDGDIALTGVVTANAGVVVDEMTLDADTLTATDDFIIDAVGEIVLDSATGITQYKDGGTEFLRISESSGDAVIQSTVQDERIFFSGDDSGSGVNALILDFALAGDATFSRNVGISMSGEAIDTRLHIDACPDNKVITFEQSGRKSCIGTLYAANSTGSRLDFHISNGNQNGGNVNRMTINASGDVQIIDGNLTVAAGHGIVFGVDGTGAGADASELLDDYEEGQWTPAPTRTSSAPTVGFSAGPNGSYVKVGRMVYASFDMTINSYSGGGGTAQLNGLPYAASSDLNSFSGFGVLIVRDSSAIPVGPTATTIVKGFVERGASHISVQYDNIGNAGSNTNSNVANFQQGRFTGYMMYPASS